MEKIKLRGFYINNLDVNIITQTPKINKYRKKIIKNIIKDKKYLYPASYLKSKNNFLFYSNWFC